MKRPWRVTRPFRQQNCITHKSAAEDGAPPAAPPPPLLTKPPVLRTDRDLQGPRSLLSLAGSRGWFSASFAVLQGAKAGNVFMGILEPATCAMP